MQNTPHPFISSDPPEAPIIRNNSALKKKICIGDMENLNLGRGDFHDITKKCIKKKFRSKNHFI